MKKFTLLFLFLAMGTMIMAQVATKSGSILDIHKAGQPAIKSTKAVGDTVMYFDGSGFYVNPTDEANFGFVNEDVDGLTPYNSTTMCNQWCYFYSDDFTTDVPMPWDVDTAFFMQATSWFASAGQADNWFSFGPLTIPSTGGVLQWYIRCNPGYRDGYKVYVSTTGMSNYTDFSSVIYSRTDAYPSPTEATDTIWQLVSVPVPGAYAGQQLYFGFQHDANDMDVLWLDEIAVIEADNIGISEKEQESLFIYPNPAKNHITISNGQVMKNVKVYNSIGQVVLNKEINNNLTKLEVSNLDMGIYFVAVQTENETITQKIYIK